MIWKLALLPVFIFVSKAAALDVTRCPSQFNLLLKVDSVVKSSIYSEVPGWKNAQTSLAALGTAELPMTLKQTTKTTCVYADSNGNKAFLKAAHFHDPELQQPVETDQLVLNLTVNASEYVSFVPVKSYAVDAIEFFSSPFSLKIKTRLFYPPTRKFVNFDLGMISLTLQ